MHKKVYLVRHGETEGNVGLFNQLNTSLLTKLGEQQADFLGKRFETIPVDVIVASPYTRTKQTTEIVNAHIKKPVEYSDLFVERRRPSLVEGRRKDDPQVVQAFTDIYENFHIPGWKHSDEENFEDLKARALLARAYLEARTEEHILVVTHGLFMRYLMLAMVRGEEYTSEEALAAVRSFQTRNTGITKCAYVMNPHQNEFRWQIVTWNDHAHLGEVE